MLAKRIIPCLDVKDGQTVKGVQFENLRQAGDPVALAKRYNEEGADELVFLDITATNEDRSPILPVIEKVAKQVFIPLTVGGGIRSVERIRELLQAGADKVSLNTVAVQHPEFITEAANQFGSQCIVVAIDVKKVDGTYRVCTHAGQKLTEHNALDWARRVVAMGAGEILLTSMETDGMQQGFDLDITRTISQAVPIPVIASGGGGSIQHFIDVFQKGYADAALAASVFHFKTVEMAALKAALHEANVEVRQ